MRLHSLIATFALTLACALGLSAQTVRVVFVSGQAELQRPDEAAPRAVTKGETVVIGTRFTTGPDGRVVLTPMPGVKSIITPNTTLTLESISENRTDAKTTTHSATIDLKQGAVVSDLQKPDGVAYDYNIRTARGVAGARGTNYTVGINAAGIQSVIVSHGSISLSLADGRLVSITPGQISITAATGDTRSVTKASELPASEQALAQQIADTSVAAIAAAVEAGELPAEALTLALDAVSSLGITLSPETQAIVDRARSLADRTERPVDTQTTELKTIKEVVTEQETTEEQVTGFTSYQAFVTSLSPVRAQAMERIRQQGFTGPDADALVVKLRDGQFIAGLLNVIDLYIELSNYYGEASVDDVLGSLGIIANGNVTAVGAEIDGLRNLVAAYHEIVNYDGVPTLLDEADYTSGTLQTLQGANYFFPGQSGHGGATLYNVVFDAASAESSVLNIGATRTLKIDNTGVTGDTFITASFGYVTLIASDLIDLNNTRFAADVASIKMQAATINLRNIDFPGGSYVSLVSRLGGTADGSTGSGNYPHFGSSQPGRVNFISGVSYGGNPIANTSQYDAHGSSIYIGQLPGTLGGGN